MRRFGAIVLFGLFLAALPTGALAISAFSRQYDVECSTCHDPYPHRTEFGEAFLRNGYVWPGAAKGDPKALVKKESHWVAGIGESIPLALTVRQEAGWDGEETKDHFTPDTRFNLHAGGNIKGAVGFFAHDLLADNSEAFAVFRLEELAGLPVNIRYGRIVPHTTLNKPNQSWFSSPALGLTLSVAGEPPPGAVRDGVEIDALLGSRLYLALGLADRKEQNPMDGFAHAEVRIGGTNYRGVEPEVDFDEASVWDYLSLTFGGYVYKGWSAELDNEYYRAGGDVELRYGGTTLTYSHLFGRDTKDADGLGVDTLASSLEVAYSHMSRWLVGGRIERLDQGNAPQGIAARGLAMASFTPLQNLWLKLEGGVTRHERGPDRQSESALFLVTYHL